MFKVLSLTLIFLVLHAHCKPSSKLSKRDSYVKAASEYGYSPDEANSFSDHSHHVTVGQPSAYKYQIYPNPHIQHNPIQNHVSEYSNNYAEPTASSYGSEPSGDGWLCRTFGGSCDDGNGGTELDRQDAGSILNLGLIGTIGLLLKKLKLIKLAPFLPFIIPLLPLLLPLGLIIIVPLLLAAFFLPIVPVVVIGQVRRSLEVAREFKNGILSEECVERISCEATRIARGYGFDAPWVTDLLNKVSPHSKWIEKVTRAGRRTDECSAFTCRPVTSIKRVLKIND